MSNQDNKLLLHMLKHTPKNGQVYITWEGETFSGDIQEIEVKRSVDSLSTFTIRGLIKQ
jgi:hypothetical protein